MEKENKPLLCLYDKQVEDYLGDKFDSLDVGDEVELTVKARVASKSKRENYTSDMAMLDKCGNGGEESDDKEDSKEPKKKIVKSIDLEIIDTKQDSAPNFKRYNARM